MTEAQVKLAKVEMKKAEIELHVQDVVIEGASLTIGELDKKGFEELGRKIKTVEGAAQLWIGDWGNALKEQHGDATVRGISELIGYEKSYVAALMQVSNRLDKKARNEYLKAGLTVTHMIRAMPAPSPSAVLDWAAKEEETPTVSELHKEVKRRTPQPIEDPPKETLFSWIKDERVVAAEEGFLSIETALDALRNATEDKEVAKILLERFKKRVAKWTF